LLELVGRNGLAGKVDFVLILQLTLSSRASFAIVLVHIFIKIITLAYRAKRNEKANGETNNQKHQ